MTRLPHDSTAAIARSRPACRAVRCATRFGRRRCTNTAAPNRTICFACKDRRWRERHPEHHLWNNLKKSAKRRGLEFAISLGWWLGWCEITGFAEMVGRTKGSASIDRIRSWEGYTETNIQILEVGANSAKGQLAPPINSEERFYSADEDPLAS